MAFLSFDLRALSLMRICMAAVIIIDLSIRISDLEAFYANTGATPLDMIFGHAWNDYYLSVHTISGLWQVQFVLFMFALFCAIMLLIGYRTRLFTVLSWFMLLSVHNRNILILQGGDDMLRMVMFWAMFIPWGARYSCDRLLDTNPGTSVQIWSLGTIAYLLQICYVYTGSALLKGPEWSNEYSALYYTYSLDQIAYPVTQHLYYYPELLRKLTFIAYYFELLVPLLFFIPVKHAFFRFLGVMLIIGFHLWNGMTLLIGIFFLVGIATAIGILPSFAMDVFDRATQRLKAHVAASFMGIAYPVQYVLKWKPPVYTLTPWMEKVRTAVLIFLILFVFDWNMSNLDFVHSKTAQRLRPIGYALRIDQCWGMFAPGVFKDDGWYVFEGVTDQGAQHLNLLSANDPISFKKPLSVVGMFKNDRWRKYAENYIFNDNSYMRGYFCNYYRRVWNEHNPGKQLKQLRIIYMKELTQPGYSYTIPEQCVLCDCAP